MVGFPLRPERVVQNGLTIAIIGKKTHCQDTIDRYRVSSVLYVKGNLYDIIRDWYSRIDKRGDFL